jgi:hypothetical protein
MCVLIFAEMFPLRLVISPRKTFEMTDTETKYGASTKTQLTGMLKGSLLGQAK